MGLAAGELNRRLILKSPTYTKDTTTGEEVAGWSTQTTSVWGKIEPLRGSEAMVAAQKEGFAQWKITTHPDLTVEPKMAFGDSSRTYHVIWAQKLDKPNDRVESFCSEKL